jgi:hypothetical protein
VFVINGSLALARIDAAAVHEAENMNLLRLPGPALEQVVLKTEVLGHGQVRRYPSGFGDLCAGTPHPFHEYPTIHLWDYIRSS